MVLINDDDISEVRERVDIIEVISSHVQLKKAGRVYKGLCPFHNEKTPSFVVDPDKQLYHCFGCGEGGNVYNFVMKMEHMDFPETVQNLAQRVGYTVKTRESPTDTKEIKSKKSRLYEINKRAVKFYQRQLLDSQKGEKARQYLKNRGYSDDTVVTFTLGYATDNWDELGKAALKQGCSKEDLAISGLSISSEKDPGSIYDRFRGRVIFPILDLQNRPIGFGGRVLGDETPKYLNSPETPIYHKGKVLYALNWAKQAISNESEAVIVEGYTDVISLFEHGIINVVATLGTALTADHLRLLVRYTKRIVLVFDADIAGEKAVERGMNLAKDFYLSAEYRASLELLERRHLDLFVVSLPPGLDPADYVEKHGEDAFRRETSKAVPLVDFCIESVINSSNTETIPGKRRAAQRTMEIIAALPSEVAREDYLKKVAELLGITYESLFVDFRGYKDSRRKNKEGFAELQVESIDPELRLEREVFQACLNSPESRVVMLKELKSDHFTLPMHKTFLTMLKKEDKEKKDLDIAGMIDRAPDEQRDLITSLSAQSVKVEDQKKYSEELLKRIKEFELKRRIDILKGQLRKVNPQKEQKVYDELFLDLLKLEATRREL